MATAKYEKVFQSGPRDVTATLYVEVTGGRNLFDMNFSMDGGESGVMMFHKEHVPAVIEALEFMIKKLRAAAKPST